jgi:thiol-disulfide isomerase/thioredoxin
MRKITFRFLRTSLAPLLGVLICASLQMHTFGADAPVAWAVTNQLGKEVRSSSLIGKVTVVNFWATWCLPCFFEMPTLHDLAKKYDKSVAVVGISVDAQSNAMLQAFADKFGMNYTVAMANPGIMNGFRVSDTVPMTFILDQQGKIVRRHVGYVKTEDLEKDIRTLLKL